MRKESVWRAERSENSNDKTAKPGVERTEFEEGKAVFGVQPRQKRTERNAHCQGEPRSDSWS